MQQNKHKFSEPELLKMVFTKMQHTNFQFDRKKKFSWLSVDIFPMVFKVTVLGFQKLISHTVPKVIKLRSNQLSKKRHKLTSLNYLFNLNL